MTGLLSYYWGHYARIAWLGASTCHMYFVGNVCNRAFVYLKMGAMRLVHSRYVILALEYSMTIA